MKLQNNKEVGSPWRDYTTLHLKTSQRGNQPQRLDFVSYEISDTTRTTKLEQEVGGGGNTDGK